MKRGFLPPAAVLAAVLAFSCWNERELRGATERWRGQLLSAESAACRGDWERAEQTLAESYADWAAARERLRMLTRHDTVDGAEELYHRCLALARTETAETLLPEIASLRDELSFLAERERFTLGNVL